MKHPPLPSTFCRARTLDLWLGLQKEKIKEDVKGV